MGQYNNKGLYNGYKKNNKEREELDYYATPRAEVTNILDELGYDFSHQTILEPCVGGGHMALGIEDYIFKNQQNPLFLIGTDFKDRGFESPKWNLSYDLDFLADDYPIDKADVVIMNPPYATLEPFLIRALEIAKEKLIVLCRMQVLEGASRYEKVLKDNPPNYVYQYVDRIQCWKNGEKPEGSSAQGYCWAIWDKKSAAAAPTLHWLRRWDKKK
jgi:hypothetical protein